MALRFSAVKLTAQEKSSELLVGGVPTGSEAVFDLFARSYVWENDIRSVTVRAINLTSQSEGEQLTFLPCLYTPQIPFPELNRQQFRHRF